MHTIFIALIAAFQEGTLSIGTYIHRCAGQVSPRYVAMIGNTIIVRIAINQNKLVSIA